MPKSEVSPFTRYTKAEGAAKPRIIANSWGEVGSGKSSFWLGAPGPIIVLSFDRGLEGVVQQYQDDKEIYVKEFEWVTAPGAQPDQSAAIDMRDEFTEEFEYAVQHARTLVIDKETDMWSVFKYAEFGAPEKGIPNDWDAVKNRCRRLMNMPKALSLNFGVIQGVRNEWISGAVNPNTGKKGMTQTGRRISSGMDDIESIMNINIEHLVDDKGVFSLKVGKARGAREIQYTTLPAMSFAEFAQLVHPDTDESSWI